VTELESVTSLQPQIEDPNGASEVVQLVEVDDCSHTLDERGVGETLRVGLRVLRWLRASRSMSASLERLRPRAPLRRSPRGVRERERERECERVSEAERGEIERRGERLCERESGALERR
jgi:hypothetical protein